MGHTLLGSLLKPCHGTSQRSIRLRCNRRMIFDITAAKKKHAVKKHDDRKRRERLLELENEETSSTTTESSGADLDDKVYMFARIICLSNLLFTLIFIYRIRCLCKFDES